MSNENKAWYDGTEGWYEPLRQPEKAADRPEPLETAPKSRKKKAKGLTPARIAGLAVLLLLVIAGSSLAFGRLRGGREDFQDRGFGREAVKMALGFIASRPCGPAEYCWVSYVPENERAKRLYHSIGFQETGDWYGDEKIAILKLRTTKE